MKQYFIRLWFWLVALGAICLLTGTLAWWPAYAEAALLLGFVPAVVLLETLPEVMFEVISEIDFSDIDFD